MRWRTTEGRKRNGRNGRIPGTSDLVIAYTEKHMYGIVFNLATSPKSGYPMTCGWEGGGSGWGTGVRARAGWEVKVKKKKEDKMQ